jgi:heterodisulfide reductase subunit C
MASRVAALSYLAWRAIAAHPAKRLFRQHGTGEERFLAAYATEGLLPTAPEDRRLGEGAARCIACGLCEPCCDLAGAAPAVRAMGLHAAFRLWSKGTPELPLAAEALAACVPCAAPRCEAACPTGVPIAAIVRRLAERAAGESAASAPPGATAPGP